MRGQVKIREREAFIGRRSELAGLKAGVDDAFAGHGCLSTLSGEPGVGKTRLAQETASYMEVRGGLAIWGRCWDHGGAPAYWPWIQVIRALAGPEPATLASWLGPGAADIAQIAPELRDQLGGLPALPSAELVQPAMARFRLFDSVVTFLRKAAEAQPLLIVLDDLHAADPTTLMLLVALARQVRGMRATVVGIYRSGQVRRQTELATLISAAEREGTVFLLRGFGPADIQEFLERAWGMPATKALVDQLSEITEGNVFFLHEVVRQITADGPIERNTPINRGRLGVTRGVRDFIKTIMRTLPEETRKALDLASVIGREFALDTLVAASALPAEELESHLEHASSFELVDELPAGRYSFRHALIRETLYEELPRASRRSMHLATAGAIRSLQHKPESSAQIAYHYCQASSGKNAELAIKYSRQAAREAEKQLAYEEAASHLRNAIEAISLVCDDRDLLKAELLCELGEAQAKSGEHAGARKTCLEAADIARHLDNNPLFARAVVTAGRRMSNSGVTDHELVALLNEGLERLSDQK
ncbi:MAG: AAA family ATPase, partial [Bradyrhizobium sp.]|nr:AAA family ATPase [Bradyrhizobium sp.]